MVIISTMATEVSIQAVSPEFGEQLVSVLASHDGGAAAAGASPVVSAKDACSVGRLSKIASISAPARAHSPARENNFDVIGVTPVRLDRGAGLRSMIRKSGCRFSERSCSIKDLERDDDSTRSHRE